MNYVRVPASRIGAVIGTNGKTKKKLESLSGCSLNIDSEEGLIELEKTNEDDPLKGLQVMDSVKAIGRGFSAKDAYKLLEEEHYLEIIDIRDYVGKSKKRLGVVRGRLIGRKGKTRTIVEDMTGCKIAIKGHTVSIISDLERLSASKVAISMLLGGSEHGAIYQYLEGFNRYNR